MNKEKKRNMRFDLYILSILLLPTYFILFRILYEQTIPGILANTFLLFYIIIYIISFGKFIKRNKTFSTEYIHAIRKWRGTIITLQNTSFILLTIGLINLGLSLSEFNFSYTGVCIFLTGLLWLIPSIILLQEIHTFKEKPKTNYESSYY